MSKLIGQNLGRYHILEQLGEGGMATVYKAYDTHLECDVAVKVIRMDRLAPEVAAKTVKRFEREARMLAQLTHPNIVKITDYGEYEGEPYLVMVYLSGGTLKHRMTGQPVPWNEAARLLAPVARALEYAHQQGMIHRDVKPANILITQSGEPMLSDFGVAKLFDSEQTANLTGTSMGVGTPEYMAPEQATSASIDSRADIYALGVVFYELVTGRKPYEADTPLAVLIKQASESLPRPSDLVRDLPAAVEGILLKAMAKKPEDRYQDMGKFAAALEGLAAGGTQEFAIPAAAPSASVTPAGPAAPKVEAPTRLPAAPSTQTQFRTPAPVQKKSGLKWLWLVLGIGAGLLLLCGGGVVILLVLGIIGSATPTPAPYSQPTQAYVAPTQMIQNPTPMQGGQGAVLDFSLSANYGSVELYAGFTPDPFQLEMTSGGDVDVSAYVSGCVGFATSAPDVELTWSGSSNALTIYFAADDSSQDTTLIINAPDGRWYCNDDSPTGGTRDPLFSFEGPLEGVYDIWVGSYQAGSFVPGSLYISEFAP